MKLNKVQNFSYKRRQRRPKKGIQAEDRILQCHIRNLPSPPSPLIEPYLREVGFWHAALVGRGCKLDPKLVSVLVERWRHETHTFYIPCGKCTITLEDVHLQLGLPMDGSVVTESVQSGDWRGVCGELLGSVSKTIYGGRIEMAWS
ncbi:serine/threonine-protein phosphatase 7 long form-like protein [Gossypium australe]|uniref:Serine/threonine-protein phosphatase 7 long form-like protein n=1 Tax=Gossypium australe TaxID=47621 RepID=A0A5B6UIF2_9ROSI|nr:serine/threonine-protein phosphatase 7 long form-like protein [Gossypium australe]